MINNWYEVECERIKHQAIIKEFQECEKVRIYHHELHKSFIKKSSILKLETPEGRIEGHTDCANFLEMTVVNLLEEQASLDLEAQETFLRDVQRVFSEDDNKMLLNPPSKEEVLEVIKTGNQHAAPGTDGLTSYFYHCCWDIMGDFITEVAQAIHRGSPPTQSQRTSLMVFGSKPKTSFCLQPYICQRKLPLIDRKRFCKKR